MHTNTIFADDSKQWRDWTSGKVNMVEEPNFSMADFASRHHAALVESGESSIIDDVGSDPKQFPATENFMGNNWDENAAMMAVTVNYPDIDLKLLHDNIHAEGKMNADGHRDVITCWKTKLCMGESNFNAINTYFNSLAAPATKAAFFDLDETLVFRGFPMLNWQPSVFDFFPAVLKQSVVSGPADVATLPELIMLDDEEKCAASYHRCEFTTKWAVLTMIALAQVNADIYIISTGNKFERSEKFFSKVREISGIETLKPAGEVYNISNENKPIDGEVGGNAPIIREFLLAAPAEAPAVDAHNDDDGDEPVGGALAVGAAVDLIKRRNLASGDIRFWMSGFTVAKVVNDITGTKITGYRLKKDGEDGLYTGSDGISTEFDLNSVRAFRGIPDSAFEIGNQFTETNADGSTTTLTIVEGPYDDATLGSDEKYYFLKDSEGNFSFKTETEVNASIADESFQRDWNPVVSEKPVHPDVEGDAKDGKVDAEDGEGDTKDRNGDNVDTEEGGCMACCGSN